jgi:hypothetical protein
MGVLADLVLFWSLYGDPLFQFHTIGATVAKIYVAQNIADTSLSPYLVYLFIKIYHTGLLGWLALMGCIAALRRPHDGNLRFVLIWGCGLLLIFSALPISLSPLKFVAKQTNYMVIFLMPFALLAGWFLSQRRHAVRIAFGAALVGSSILLSAMEQQVIRVVTANGQTAIDFAKQHPNEPTFGSETVSRQSVLNRVMNGSLDDSKDIRAIGDLRDLTISSGQLNDIVAYVIEDPQLSHWQSSQKDEGLIHKIQLCGGVVERLPFPDNLGWGRPVVGALYNASALLPLVVAGPIRTKLETIYKIESATVYSITRECDQILRAF